MRTFSVQVRGHTGDLFTLSIPAESEGEARIRAARHGDEVVHVREVQAIAMPSDATADDRTALIMAGVGLIFPILLLIALIFASRASAKSGGKLGGTATRISVLGLILWACVGVAAFVK